MQRYEKALHDRMAEQGKLIRSLVYLHYEFRKPVSDIVNNKRV